METRLAGDPTAVCSQACVCLITQEAGSHIVPQQLAVMLSCLVSMGTAFSCFLAPGVSRSHTQLAMPAAVIITFWHNAAFSGMSQEIFVNP